MPSLPLSRRRARRPGSDPARTPRSAAWPVRSAAWAIEEKVLWPGADAARAAADGARYPFERLAWAIERRVIWPLQDATAAWSRAARTTAVGGLAAAALAAGTAGALTAPAAEEPATPAPPAEPVVSRVAAPVLPTPASAPTPVPAEAVEGPVLKGATPTFEVVEEADAANPAAAKAGTPVADPADPAASKPVPGQKEAIRTAERFAQAFVLYEIGEETREVREVFAQTTSPALAEALRERPPRQPAGVEVPKARVLNVVPGPSHGDRLTVSAALLRVGATTELRLDLRRTDEGWRITDVRG